MSSAPDPAPPRPRPRPRGADRRRRRGRELAHLPGRRDPPEPAPAAPPLRARGDLRARRVDPAQGVLQPVVVRPRRAGGYELIAGERRWRAAREAGVDDGARARARGRRPRLAPARPRRERRPRAAVARSRRRAPTRSLLDEFELSLGEVAERVGRSKPAVSNRLRLLELPDDVLSMLERGELTEGHARAVLAVPDQEARRRLARRIVREGMSVRAAERAAQDGGARAQAARGDRGRPGARRRVPRSRPSA